MPQRLVSPSGADEDSACGYYSTPLLPESLCWRQECQKKETKTHSSLFLVLTHKLRLLSSFGSESELWLMRVGEIVCRSSQWGFKVTRMTSLAAEGQERAPLPKPKQVPVFIFVCRPLVCILLCVKIPPWFWDQQALRRCEC